MKYEMVKEEMDSVVAGLYDFVTTKMDVQKFDSLLNHRSTASWYNIQKILVLNKVEPFVEVLSGKYKGSIGNLKYDVITLGEKHAEECKLLSAKSLKLLPDYNGRPFMAVRERTIKDIFDQTIEPGDKVIFAERGKLRIGVLVEYRFHDNKAIITTPEGKEEVNPRTSQIVNCQKINESFIGKTVLTAKLRGDYE